MKSEMRRFQSALLSTLIPGILLTTLLFVLFYLLVSGGYALTLSYWFSSLPTGIRAFHYILAALDMSDPVVFFSRFYQPVYFLLCLAACILGGRCLNSDECGLWELWYTIPGPRTRVFLRRYFGGLAVLAVLNLALLGVTIGFYTLLFIPNLSYISMYAIIFLRMAVVEGIFYAIGILFSACLHRSGKSARLSVLVLLVLWGIALIPAFTGQASFLMYAAIPYYGIPEFALQSGPFYSLLEGGILGAVFACSSIAALFVYRRKQFCLHV